MAEIRYTSRGMRRRRGTDKWEVTLSHTNPMTGETVRTFHTIEAKTEKQAKRKRDELILDLERQGGSLASGLTLAEFMERFVDYKQESGTIEPSTVRGCRAEAHTIARYIGEVKLGAVTIADVNEPKTQSSVRTIPLTRHTWELLASMRAEAARQLAAFGLSAADAYVLGTQEPESRPYNPTQLGKDFAAFCRMNGFKCTFHVLRHTFATMMIAKGVDVRTVASYLGHASVSMTLDIYADVDPDAKKAAVSKVQDCFDMDFDDLLGGAPAAQPAATVPGVTFTVEQLEALLAQARAQERQFKVVWAAGRGAAVKAVAPLRNRV